MTGAAAMVIVILVFVGLVAVLARPSKSKPTNFCPTCGKATRSDILQGKHWCNWCGKVVGESIDAVVSQAASKALSPLKPMEKPPSIVRDKTPAGLSAQIAAQVADAISCSKCGTRHLLGHSSVMISPSQAFDALFRSGAIVIQGDGVSREYLVATIGELSPNLRKETLAALVEAKNQLKQGQELTWQCRECSHCGNEFPGGWSRGARPSYPSDRYFLELSKRLLSEHGQVVLVTDCGSLSAVRWKFRYKDGHEIVVGNPGWPEPRMKVDIDFFPGMVGAEGKTYAKVFFNSAGLDIAGLDICDMLDGAVFRVHGGKLIEVK